MSTTSDRLAAIKAAVDGALSEGRWLAEVDWLEWEDVTATAESRAIGRTVYVEVAMTLTRVGGDPERHVETLTYGIGSEPAAVADAVLKAIVDVPEGMLMFHDRPTIEAIGRYRGLKIANALGLLGP